ncbi:MAG: hypothetical protein J7647_05990 [Cyanobacteria bacterium SBLK]|nr:hypothetical protein [Cyanobacteria bacterium SBLK]
MIQIDLLEQAKQGHPQAIAALLARQFQPKGITVSVTLHEECLSVAIAAIRIPKQTTFSAYVRQSLSKLAPQGINRVEVSGYQEGDRDATWQEAFFLFSPPSPPSPPSPLAPPAPLWLQWTIANLKGIAVLLVLQHAFLFLGVISGLDRHLTTGLFVATAIVAAMQSSLLQKRFALGGWWIPATLAGLGVRAIVYPFLPPLFAVGVGIVASTLLQWWTLRKKVREDLLWIWGNLGGLVAGIGAGSAVARVGAIAMENWASVSLTLAIFLGFLVFSSIQGATIVCLLPKPSKFKPRSPRNARFITSWSLTATLGFALFVTLANMGGSGLNALLGHGFYGCVVGLVAGGLQSWILTGKLKKSDRWLWGTVGGYALFFGLSGLVGMNINFFALFLAIGGAIVGTAQWWGVLRGQVERSHWWIAAMAIGGLLTGLSLNGLSGGLVAGGMMLWLLSGKDRG